MEESCVKRPEDVQYYSSKEHELAQTQIHKAHKFLELGCIGYDQIEKCFYCKPINGYNSTTYKMRRDQNSEFGFCCDCQGFQTKMKRAGPGAANCSHVLALHYWFDWRNRRNSWGPYGQQKL